MPFGEVSVGSAGQELQNAAVVGNSQPVPRDLSCTSAVANLGKTLPAAARMELDQVKRVQYYPSRSVLFCQAGAPTGVFIVKRGTVKLSMTSSKGRVVILRIAGAGEILGLSSVLSGEPYQTEAETLEETEVAYVEREQFLTMLLHHPEAALSVAIHACANYKRACQQIALLGLCRSASERVAQFLLNWIAPKTYRDASPVWLGLTHEEISQIAGTTRETVTRTLVDFRNKGWASLGSSRLAITDRAALEKLVA